ncbi:leucine-rich repeat-containing protein 34 [Halyomorpha halys]|uniref:leucine-rich repeat-containing protein 34 n=1 Tax=Halyomorpha halys TaxID=286706 RepID=UPI0006D4E7B4|nr:leucine-rich repeat-containing protein 34-like [Halyomorpha halys]
MEESEILEKFEPKVNLCPPSPFKNNRGDLLENPMKMISRLFLSYSSKKLSQGFELSLKGDRVFKMLGRRIENGDLPTIFVYIGSEEEILSLDLSNNHITDQGFEMLCQFLLHSKLLNLNLRNNDIKNLTEKGCQMLGNVTCLRRLTLSGNHLSQKSADYMQAILKDNKSLEVLELEGVDFYIHSLRRIVDMLLNFNNTLKVLNISRLLSVPKYKIRSYYLADLLYTLLVGNNTLVELHLEKNGISDHDVETIFEALKSNQTLTLLNLTANYVSNVGLEKIAKILPGSNLQVLLLRRNTIGNHGAIALSKAMPLSRILHLDIAHNRIEDIGLANLLWTIKKPTPLYTFYIFGNQITTQTLEIIHMQMLRGKIMPDSLDIVLYWDQDGSIRCSYNPDADEYRNQMANQYGVEHVAPKENILPYPIIDIFHPSKLLERIINYPKATSPKIYTNYLDHISVK